MPGIVKLTPNRPSEDHEDGCPELVELPLKSLLKSHVLSQDGGYLLPVSSLLSQEYLSTDAQSEPVHNPYWDPAEDGSNFAYILPPDLKKLERHSSFTKALADTKRAHFALVANAGAVSWIGITVGSL